MIDSLFSVWTPAAVTVAVFGGFLVGLLVVSRFDNPRFDARESVAVVSGLFAFVGFVFWSAQAVEVFVSEGPTLGWRVVSRFLLFVVFCAFTGLGTGVGVARAQPSVEAEIAQTTTDILTERNAALVHIAVALAENTALTQQASDKADRAHDSASRADDSASAVRETLRDQNETLLAQGEQAAEDRLVGADTNETAHRIDERIP